jgi:opacity protein-like surface antigen
MRRYLLASAAALVIATPAAATTDNSGYVGIEGGILFPKSQSVSGNVIFTNTAPGGPVNFATTGIGSVKYKKGLDLDFIGGYDFGMFKLEGELGYKHAKSNSFGPNNAFVTAINTGAGTAFTTNTNFGINNSTTVYSGMVNGLLDLGGNGNIGGYVGGGVGYASVHQFGNSHGGFAWQLIAGAYAPITSNIDIGLKYRYFRGPRNNGSNRFAFSVPAGAVCGPAGATFTCSPGTATFTDNGRFASSSLLASLVYNFGVSAPPPPPPAPTERGERGK